MRTDTKAVLKVIGASAVIAVLAMGILAASALGAFPRDVAIPLALVCIVGGGAAVGLIFVRGLTTRVTSRSKDR
jgi:hypothetical protein